MPVEVADTVKSPDPFPSRIATLLVLDCATARSGRPSRLKSPTATDSALPPTPSGEVAGGVKLVKQTRSVQLLSRITILLAAPVTTARSGLPSRLKSPTDTESEASVTISGDVAGCVKPPRPSPSR